MSKETRRAARFFADSSLALLLLDIDEAVDDVVVVVVVAVGGRIERGAVEPPPGFARAEHHTHVVVAPADAFVLGVANDLVDLVSLVLSLILVRAGVGAALLALL